MQLSLFDEGSLDAMVEDGRFFVTTRFLELRRDFPKQGKYLSLSSYVDKLILYDVATGRLPLPEFTIKMFDDYVAHVKRMHNDDAYEVMKFIHDDLEDKFEYKYNSSRIKEVYPFIR